MSMTIQQAIENRERCLKYLEGCAVGTNPESVEAVRLSLEALREKAERENPKPLTIEELRQMDGEPVWIKADHCGLFADVVKIHGKEDGDAFVGFVIHYRMQENGCGKTWTAYRHKPKEETK